MTTHLVVPESPLSKSPLKSTISFTATPLWCWHCCCYGEEEGHEDSSSSSSSSSSFVFFFFCCRHSGQSSRRYAMPSFFFFIVYLSSQTRKGVELLHNYDNDIQNKTHLLYYELIKNLFKLNPTITIYYIEFRFWLNYSIMYFMSIRQSQQQQQQHRRLV